MRNHFVLKLLLAIGLFLLTGCRPKIEEVRAAEEDKNKAAEEYKAAEERRVAMIEERRDAMLKALNEIKVTHKKEVVAFCKEFSEYYKVTENEVTGDWKMEFNYGFPRSEGYFNFQGKSLKPDLVSWLDVARSGESHGFKFEFEMKEIRYGISKPKKRLYLKIDEEKLTLEPSREPFNYISGERMRNHYYKISLETLNKIALAASVKYSLDDNVGTFGSEELIKKLANYFNDLNAKKPQK